MATDQSLSAAATAAALAADPKHPKGGQSGSPGDGHSGSGQSTGAPARAGDSNGPFWDAVQSRVSRARSAALGAARRMGWTRGEQALDFVLSVSGLMLLSLGISLLLLLWLYSGLRGASDSPTADAVNCLSHVTGTNATTLGTALLGVGCGLLLCGLCSAFVYIVHLQLRLRAMEDHMMLLRVRLEDVQSVARQTQKTVSDALQRGGSAHLFDADSKR